MSTPRIIILTEYPTPEIVAAHIRHAHHLRAETSAQWLRSIGQHIRRLFSPRQRIAVKRPLPPLSLPRIASF
ncbi:RSP_7527 family protein [Oceanibaculum indicum]|uniref:Uncharacterized protein n=1 Tax=Oceanibaculum indicum P24 TaxID=1207063 RepID=K2JG91_9PROT|nr:hypothetical protein [Oceanibaculum indicum]EKE73592.1 hypothetical protein P24_12911 [Oceanibaculum indicum P24]